MGNVESASSADPNSPAGQGYDWKNKKKLGEGGFGVTYLVPNPEGRKVVVKELRRKEDADPEWNALKHIQSICHKNLLCGYDLIIGKKKAWIVSEFIDGYSLADKEISNLEEGKSIQRLHPKEIGQLAIQMLEALKLLHTKYHMVHRDIKTDNIMFDRKTNSYRLIDFGCASIENESKEFVGTMYYISPELWNYASLDRPIPFKVMERGDLVALGITLFVLLEGEIPFMRTEERLEGRTIKTPEGVPPYTDEDFVGFMSKGNAIYNEIPQWLIDLIRELMFSPKSASDLYKKYKPKAK